VGNGFPGSSPSAKGAYWQAFLTSMQADIDLRIEDEGRPDLRDLVGFRPITADAPIVTGGLTVTALPAIHPPLSDCWSLSFRAGGRHVVFSGDTAHNPALVDFARGADLLIHEAMLAEGLAALAARVGNGDDRLLRHLQRSHTLAADAARVAAAAGVRALALHHLIPSDDPDFGAEDWRRAVAPHWTGPLYLGTDGLRLPLD
jgi:ribonuclease BN (tRNA processing enzyme)